MISAVDTVSIDRDQHPLSIEYQWLGIDDASMPLMVFLHEGLGSLAMWKDFPARLCDALGCRGLVYSRPGYGQSTVCAADESWGTDFMHRQAYSVLPSLLQALGVDASASPLWILGHSDGGSIALLYAAKFAGQVAGLIVLSPHIMVEDCTVKSIQLARKAYLETDLKLKLAKYHNDPDSPFWGWNNIWLHPDFRDWSIEDEVAAIRCPLLAVQGIDDEYGTLEQVHGIARRVPQTEVVELVDCGHSAHRDQAQELIRIATGFVHDNVTAEVTGRTEKYA